MGASGSGLEAIGLMKCGRNVSPLLSHALTEIPGSRSLIIKGQNMCISSEVRTVCRGRKYCVQRDRKCVA